MRVEVMSIEIALSDLARLINAEHEACLNSAKDAIDRAIEVGRLLSDAKGKVQHGGWADWVEVNCSFGPRQASNYMKAYHHRDAVEANRNPGSDLGGLKGMMRALAGPVDREEQDERHPSGRKPVTEWTTEERRWTCETWWDQMAAITMTLDAAEWEADRIADFIGMPRADVEAILSPMLPIPGRGFTVWEDGGCLIDSDNPGDKARAAQVYAANVEHIVFSMLAKGCRQAILQCDADGFGHVKPILKDRERRFQRQQEAAERRGASRLGYMDPEDLGFGPDTRETAGRVALNSCIWSDARHAVRVDSNDRWDPELMTMWMRFYGVTETIEAA
jgi:hypothetical protein